MKQSILGAAIAAGLVLAGAADAVMIKQSNQAGAIPPGIRAPSAVLYSQLDNPAGNGVPDQNFESSIDAYDAIAADDFVVGDADGWTIEQISTVGTYSVAGPVDSVNVAIRANSPGGGNPDLPGTAVCSYSNVVPTTDSSGSFVIDLPTDCIVGPGTYWLEIQVNMDFGAGGQHFWSNRSTQTGSEAVWVNPGDGFGTGCTTYSPQTTCGVGGGVAPDLLFQIDGVVGGLVVPSTPVPVDSRFALIGLGILLAGAGAVALRRKMV